MLPQRTIGCEKTYTTEVLHCGESDRLDTKVLPSGVYGFQVLRCNSDDCIAAKQRLELKCWSVARKVLVNRGEIHVYADVEIHIK